jgi:hypothetical protein
VKLGKKQKKIERSGPNWSEEGNCWAYTCIKRNTYLFASIASGKWTQETCRKMIGVCSIEQNFHFQITKSRCSPMEMTHMVYSFIRLLAHYALCLLNRLWLAYKDQGKGRVIDKDKDKEKRTWESIP